MVQLHCLSMQNYANKTIVFEYKLLGKISNQLIDLPKNMQNTRTSAI